MDYSHPLGNIKIGLIKLLSRAFSLVSLNFLKLFFNLNKRNSEVIISSAFFAPWKENKQFKKLNSWISGTTLLDNKRLYTLYYLAESLKNVNGDIFDIGCLKGGAGYAMSYVNKKGKTHLIDSFEGIIENEKFHTKDHFIFKNINFVKEMIKKLKLKKTFVHKGIFPNSFKKQFKKNKINKNIGS